MELLIQKIKFISSVLMTFAETLKYIYDDG